MKEDFLKDVGAEFYYKLYKLEIKLKDNLINILSKIEENFLELINKKEESQQYICKGYFHYLKEQHSDISQNYDIPYNFQLNDSFVLKGLMQELDLQEESKRAKFNKNNLSLGFFIQLLKWQNVKVICEEIKNKTGNYFWEYHFTEIVFPEVRIKSEDEYCLIRDLKNDTIYKDFSKIQTFRNDFFHFKNLDKIDFKKIRELLDYYIAIL